MSVESILMLFPISLRFFYLNSQYKEDYYSKLIKHYQKSKDFYDNLSFVYKNKSSTQDESKDQDNNIYKDIDESENIKDIENSKDIDESENIKDFENSEDKEEYKPTDYYYLIGYFDVLYKNNDHINIYFEAYKLLLEISKILFPYLFINDRFRKRLGKNEIDKRYPKTDIDIFINFLIIKYIKKPDPIYINFIFNFFDDCVDSID